MLWSYVSGHPTSLSPAIGLYEFNLVIARAALNRAFWRIGIPSDQPHPDPHRSAMRR
jgi:hypothetical protein